ncbi:MAG: hypothetical protein JRJ65_00960 [Deltaproteobacteria bacterium]|nr:hypothetical protein [Deltaproteobacteria bacterium]
MENIKISLVDNDYVVRAEMGVVTKWNNALFKKFIKEIREGLVPGETAHLEIEGLERDSVTFEISMFE